MVNQRAKGELILKYAGGPEVIPTFDQGEALKKGILDMIYTSGPYISALVPEAMAQLLTTITPTEQRKSGYLDLMNESLKKKMNAFDLGRLNHWQYSMFTTKHIDNLAALAGRKFRTVPTYAPMYKELGIVGVMMPLGEAYTALERGLVEGVTIPPASVIDFKWHEVLKYKFGPNFWTCDPLLVINLDKWNKLPKHLQGLLIQCMIEAEPISYERDRKEMANIYAELYEKHGMKKTELSPADTQRLLDIVYAANWKDIEEKAGLELTAKLKKAAMTK